jgi:hypothetical protein
MKLFLNLVLFCLLISSNQVISQSNDKGNFSLSLGYDFAAHLAVSENRVSGNLIDTDSSGAATQLAQINLHYGITKWFSAGLGFRKGSYLEDPQDPDGDNKYKTNKVGEMYLDTRFYFLNKDKFNMYSGLSFGLTNLKQNFTNPPLILDYTYKGNTYRLGLGLNWYFTKYVGLWFNLDYSGRKYELTDYVINGSNQILSNINYTLQTKGVHAAIGISAKI